MNIRNVSVVTLAGLIVLLVGVTVYAQHMNHHQGMQHQQMTMQQQMTHMHAMSEHMSDMMERSHHLSQMLGQMMENHQGAMHGQMGNLQQMSQSMGAMAQQMKANLTWCQEMLQDETMMKEPGMQQDISQYQEHMQKMSDQMEGALQNLEKMTKMLQKSGGEN